MAGNTDPITDERLAELDRLREVAKLGPMVSVHIISPGYEHCANLCTRLEGHKSDYPVAMMQATWADVLAAQHNAYPALRARLAEAEREREERRIQAGRAQEALRFLMNGLPANDAVWAAYGNLDSARAWLAARDAQQRREGAIEALEGIAKDEGIDGGKAYIAKVAYREFPDLKHTSVGVVNASDLMAEAKRLRERGE